MDVRLAVCVIASHNEIYDAYKNEWIRYIKACKVKPYVSFYFIYNNPSLTDVQKITHELYTDLYFPFEETIQPGILQKTHSFYKWVFNNNIPFTHMLRTNLSSFFDFDEYINLLKTLDTKELILGKCIDGKFPSGCGTTFSYDVIEKITNLITNNHSILTIPENDDVVIGHILTHLRLSITSYDYVEFTNLKESFENDSTADEDVRSLIALPHFHYRTKQFSYKTTMKSVDWFRMLVDKYISTSVIAKKYAQRCIEPSDINEHLPTLHNYAKECSHITECGVRSVVSSYAFASGLLGNKDAKLVQVDLNFVLDIKTFIDECAVEGIEAKFYEMSDLECPIEKTDLLFIDTWHVYGHLKRELARWYSHTTKYIILHDTTVDEWDGETIRVGWNAQEQSLHSGIPVEEICKGLWPAVEEFLLEHKEWILHERFTNNNGLTILKRITQ